MGGSVSRSKSVLDVANEFVSEVVIDVVKRNSTNVTQMQQMDFSCDPVLAAAELCTIAQNSYATRVDNMNLSSTDKKDLLLNYKSPACIELCNYSDITQDMSMDLTITGSTTETITNGLVQGLEQKLDEQLKGQNTGTLGWSDTRVEAYNTIRNNIKSYVNTKVVNESLTDLKQIQNIKSDGSKLKNISKKMVNTVMANKLVTNAITTDTEFESTLAKALVMENTTSGALDNMNQAIASIVSIIPNGSTFAIIMVCLVILAVGAAIVRYKMMSSSNTPDVQNNQYTEMPQRNNNSWDMARGYNSGWRMPQMVRNMI